MQHSQDVVSTAASTETNVAAVSFNYGTVVHGQAAA